MARKKNEVKMVQFNMTIPEVWKNQLENLARIYSVEEERTVTLQELIRVGIKEKFQLQGVDEDGRESDCSDEERDGEG